MLRRLRKGGFMVKRRKSSKDLPIIDVYKLFFKVLRDEDTKEDYKKLKRRLLKCQSEKN